MFHHLLSAADPAIRAVFLSALLLIPAATGCQSWSKSHISAVRSFQSGQIAESHLQLQASREGRGAESDLLTLEQSIVHLAAGQPSDAERSLREVRRKLEHLTQKDLTEQTSAVLSDDRAIAFAGRDYERTMVLNLLMLSSLLSNGQDSFAYAVQCRKACRDQYDLMLAKTPPAGAAIAPGMARLSQESPAPAKIQPAGFAQVTVPGNAEQTAITASPDQQPLALASYLAAAAFSEKIQEYQQTEQAMAEIAVWNPEFVRRDSIIQTAGKGTQTAAQEPQTAGMGTQTQAGFGCVQVFVFVGHAPEWVAETAAPTSAALLIADRILTVTGKHTLPPTIAPVKIGRPVADLSTPRPGFLTGSVTAFPAASNESQTVAAHSAQLSFLPLLNLNDVAEASYRENRDEEIARAITRRIIKKGAVYALKETQQIHRNSLVDLAVNVGGVVWEALEKPDLRSWRLLPARLDVARAECPAGEARLEFQIAGQPRPLVVNTRVDNGRNTYVALFVPERQFAGHVLIGGSEYRTVPLTPPAPR